VDLLNETPFKVAWIAGKIRPPQWSATVIVKGTFRLHPDGVASPLPEQPEWEDVDELAYFKPRTDLLLTGTCHAPGREPVTACRVTFRVGRFAKSLGVVGDRGPFERTALTYENAYGGPGVQGNPVGKEIPNIVYPDRPGAKIVAGFGPIPGTWPQRASRVGTFGQKWLKERWPWYPEDWDGSYFNTAPQDQQLEGYLTGEEEIYLENLHPEHSVYRCRLPGLRVRFFVLRREKAHQEFCEVSLRLDTLRADMDEERLTLLWRGHTDVRSEKMTDWVQLFTLSESTQDAPRSLDACRRMLEEALAKKDADEADPDEPEEEEAAEESEEAPEEKEDAGEEDPDLPKIEWKPPEGAADLQATMTEVSEFFAERELEVPTQLFAMLAPHELPEENTSEEDLDGEEEEEDPPEEAEPPTRDQVLARIARGESLEDQDLTGIDLACADLRGINFKNAILQGAVLTRARLEGADFRGASLAQADLREANCQGAIFHQADMAETNLDSSDLSGANLHEADLSKCSLRGATLSGVRAEWAIFANADLSRADLEAARLESADLSGCRLHEADLSRANLTSASLAHCWGRKVRAEGAVVGKLKAAGAILPEGDFRQITGEESIWEGAQLYGADFSGSHLPGAEFSSAYLGSASLCEANLSSSTLDGAVLRGARMTRSSLLRASILKADLAGADLRESNLYEAKLMEANLEGTNLESTNRKGVRM